MPVARFEMPDGRIARFEVPEGTTPEAAQSMIEGEVTRMSQPVAPETKLNTTEAGILGALQGASFGLGDELSAALFGGGAYLADKAGLDTLMGNEQNKPFSHYYDKLRDEDTDALQDAAQNHKAAFITGNVAGALGTGIAGGATKAGQAANNFLRSGNLVTRAVKGAGAGATSGGLYGFGAAEDGQRLEGAREGATIGALTGGVLPVATTAVKSGVDGAKNIYRGATARGVDQLDESLAAIRDRSNAAYQQMRDSGAVLTNKGTSKVVTAIDKALKESGPLNKRIHGDTIAVMNDLRGRARRGQIGLEELEQFRQLFGDMAADIGNKSNARTAGIVRGALDDALNTLDEGAFKAGSSDAIGALRTGRTEYARAKKFETVLDAVKRADGDANALKRNFVSLLNNPKKLRGFSADEIAALKEAARNTTGESLLKMAGKFGFDLGSGRAAGNTGLPGLTLGGTALVGDVGTGGMITTAGTAARYGQKALASGKAENLLRTIEGAAPQGTTQSLRAGFAIPAGETAAAIDNTITPRPNMLGRTMGEMARDQRGTVQFPDAKAAKKWMKDNLTGRKFKNDETGWDDVQVFNSDLGKLYYSNGAPEKRESLTKIPEIIKEGAYVGSEPYRGTDRNISKVHRIRKRIGLSSGDYDAEAVIFEMRDGKKYYSHDLTKLTPAVIIGTGQLNGEGTPSPAGANTQYMPIGPQSQATPPPDILSRIAQAESSGNPNAKAPTSTASGLFQFTDQTWKDTVRKYGREYGVKMQDKASPEAQRLMAGALMGEHQNALGRALGREPTEGELYLAHFAGSGGAKRLLKAPSSAPAARLLPAAAKANRAIFYDGKRMRTVGEVIQIITEKV